MNREEAALGQRVFYSVTDNWRRKNPEKRRKTFPVSGVIIEIREKQALVEFTPEIKRFCAYNALEIMKELK